MKKFLVIVSVFFSILANAQPWKFVGSTTGINNATEVDIEISAGGQLFMAYIDSDNSHKITVKKWSNQAWVLVGTAGISSANAFDIQLIMRGENPVVGAKVNTTIATTTYEFLEVYAFNGTSWTSLGVGTYFWTYHSKDFALSCNSSLELFVSYYNRETQALPGGLITVKLGTSTFIGGGNLEDYPFFTAASAVATTGNNVLLAYESDMDMDYGISLSNMTTATHNNYTYNYGTDALKIVFEKGLNSTNYSMMHLTESYSARTLYYQASTGTTFGNLLQVASTTTLSDFDFSSQGTNTFVFYNTGSTCYFKQITGDLSPSTTITTITSGTSLAPGNASSLAAESLNGVHVIAYISGGKCYVKEYDQLANIEDYDLFQTCEGVSYNNNGDVALINLDPNFSQANITMTCTSQNTAIIPNSAISITGNGLAYYLNITSTNNVTGTTTVDLLWTLYENGTPIGTQLTPVTIFDTPTITFNLNSTTICENQNPVNLIGKAIPLGGTWSGSGVSGNFFIPSTFNPTPTTNAYVTYTKTSVQGCTAKDSALITIQQAPDLTIFATNADCDQANGSASVTITGGSPLYSSYWSSGATTTSVANLLPGQYFVTVTDANNCQSVGVASVGSNGIALSHSQTQVQCNGGANGGINLTINGTNPPFAISWSNGSTTEDLNNVAAGPYEVTVTDNNGCVSTASYTILEPAPISLVSATITPAACSSTNGSIQAVYSGGSQPFNYTWENEQGITIGSSATLTNVAAGHYLNTVVDANGCSHQESMMISNPNGPMIAIDTTIASDCSNNGSITISDVSSNVSSYSWNNGSTSQNLTNVAPGTYVVTALGTNGCVSMLSAEVQASQPIAVDLCLVTVDTATNTNLIVWEKPITTGIDHFNIYRETSQAGLYQLIAQVPYTDESIYNDLVASPSVRSWRYKIESVDACGITADISVHHKTIHLVISQGLGGNINLAWDSYEGFSYSQFVIYRHTNVDNWVQLTTMPTNLFTYTDTPPTTAGLIYLVVVDAPQTCSTTKAQDFNTTRSNKDRSAMQGATESVTEILDAQTLLYPSPTTGIVEVVNNSSYQLSGSIFDAQGRYIQAANIAPGHETLDLSHLANGVYQLELVFENAKVKKSLVIQH